MCIHTNFLAIKSRRANQRSRMFVSEQLGLNLQLSPSFNIDGTKAETTLVRMKPEPPKRKKHAPPASTAPASLNADALLDLALEKHRNDIEAPKDRQLMATGGVLQLKDKPEPEKETRETQTSTEPEVSDGAELGWPEYRALFKDEALEDYGRFQRLLVLKLFCPLIVEDGLPVVLHPKKVEDLGYDSKTGIVQLTRDLIGTERHEMMLFFHRFERALHIGKLDGSNPNN